ncbi:MAG TPA: DUF192 domain-containing protein [Candidatus Bathyarchaeia archaeon]|nr:DUF192 domain-containing protein [Candidatus Bathyarchaeia archaeon]
MKKFFAVFLAFFSILIGALAFQYYKNYKKTENIPQVIVYDEQEKKIVQFKVELAITEPEKNKGLMGREYLSKDRGMLFIYPQEQNLSFWMKNTLIPLDIIYISAEKKIFLVVNDVPPCRTDICPGYPSGKPGQYVLEINAGLSESLGIKAGQKVEFSFP